jgi:hypothetical protein
MVINMVINSINSTLYCSNMKCWFGRLPCTVDITIDLGTPLPSFIYVQAAFLICADEDTIQLANKNTPDQLRMTSAGKLHAIVLRLDRRL